MTVNIKNVNRVPLKQWRKWSVSARSVFNDCYDFYINNQSIMNHPKAQKLKPYYWKTISWNAAWIAADATDGTIPEEIINV